MSRSGAIERRERLGYGPRSAGGDPFAEDAADGGMTATAWYANLVPLWWDGRNLPVPAPGSVGDDVKWTLNG